jgi:rhodanese-related sulfurtransferase
MREVTLEQFWAAAARGEACFDARREADAPLAGAVRLTLADVQAGRLPDIDPSTPVYLVCEYGAMSELVGLYLEAAGFGEVRHVTGGLRQMSEPQGLQAEKSESLM